MKRRSFLNLSIKTFIFLSAMSSTLFSQTLKTTQNQIKEKNYAIKTKGKRNL
ncbi:hypothetical protein [Campylobacter sp. US33a]|uniref:hypothetical protein n=1 Tax=Campylobacter sp. US33a TaxID=2498120 RepID=UPI001419F4B0|nr:hypothetical protein [Campylobacter sp. US33a]